MSLEDIRVWNWWILLSFCWVSTFFDILILNFLWAVAQTTIKHTVFWKSMMRSFRWKWINCFNRFRFLAEVSTNLKTMHYFWQFKDHNSGKKKETRQTTPFFSSTFWALTVCDIHFCISKLSKFIFMGSPLWTILEDKM